MQSNNSTNTIASVTLRIDAARAAMLWSNAARASDMDFDGRFEAPGQGDYVHDHAPIWDNGRLMWCDTALEAMILADYEEACGFRSRLLWDLASADWNGPGHTVLSTRPLAFGSPVN